MVLLSVPVFWQDGFIGVVVILAVLVDTIMHKTDDKKVGGVKIEAIY